MSAQVLRAIPGRMAAKTLKKSIFPNVLARKVQDGKRSFSQVSHSSRIEATDVPCVVQMQEMLAKYKDREGGILSLAQGIVHWSPPDEAIKAAQNAAADPKSNMYGPAQGIPELTSALKEKLLTDNNIKNSQVMATMGANQAFTNLVVALLDSHHRSVLFAPYYFNHYMCLQMTGGGDGVLFGQVSQQDLTPDVDWLKAELKKHESTPNPIKMVVVCNPCNPTGIVIPGEKLRAISDACREHAAWLVVDNTYEHFTYAAPGSSEGVHECVEDDHVVNVFSFSKAYGMMGWRMGYIAYPNSIAPALNKVQDTIPICPSIISQRVALGALEAGNSWVEEKVQSLVENKRLMLEALEPLKKNGEIWGGSGAIYLMAKLPPGSQDDEAVLEYLAAEHGVCAIPGSACGAPGMIRVCYANLASPLYENALDRLYKGLVSLS